MSVLNTKCPTCKGLFKSVDDVYGTSCGHLFHIGCLQDWKRRGSSCPQCYAYNPTTHKIYINFEESEDRRAEEKKLLTCNEKISQLSHDLSKCQINFLQLQKEFTAIEANRKDLENRIREIKDYEDNYLNLQEQFTECVGQVREFQECINQLNIENECQSKELQLKCIENLSLTTSLEASECILSADLLNEKVNVLERRLKHISEELEKQIASNTKFSVENLRLKSNLAHLSSVEKVAKLLPKESDEKPSTKRTDEKPFKNEIEKQPSCNKNKIVDFKSPDVAKSQNPNKKIAFIRGLSLDQIEYPLENMIIKIASYKNLSISKHDVISVNFIDENRRECLKVEFKSRTLKDKFLSKSFASQGNSLAKSIHISEIENEELYLLFKHAKDNLKNCGYEFIFSRGSNIYAKMFRSMGKAVCIKNMAQVDRMKKRMEKFGFV